MKARLAIEIIRGLQQGDEGCFNIVYDHYRDLLYVLIYSIVKQREMSQDILQETFLRVFTESKTLTNLASFHAWIIKIARNLALNAQVKQRETLLDEATWNQVGSSDEPTNFISLWHRYLSEEENLIIAYRIVYELTFLEIARLVGKPLATIYQSYRNATKTLRHYYQSERGNHHE